MAMPKAAIHKNNGLILGEYNIWGAWQTFVVFAITKAFRKKILPHQYFGFGVFSLYSRHVVAAGFFGFDISHFCKWFPGTLQKAQP